jgi:hypothetical protein
MVEIGKIIENILRQKRMPIIEFAQKINTNRNNVCNIFRRKTIDTGLLLKIGEILDHDFFQYFITNKTRTSILSERNSLYLVNSELKVLKEQNDKLEKEIKDLQNRLEDKEMIIKLLKEK